MFFRSFDAFGTFEIFYPDQFRRSVRGSRVAVHRMPRMPGGVWRSLAELHIRQLGIPGGSAKSTFHMPGYVPDTYPKSKEMTGNSNLRRLKALGTQNFNSPANFNSHLPSPASFLKKKFPQKEFGRRMQIT